LCQFPIALHCTLVKLPPPSLSHHPYPTPLKAIARYFIVLFHICIYKSHQPYSLAFISPIHSLAPTSTPAHTDQIYGLVFIISKVNGQRAFLMYHHCKYTLLWSVQCLSLISFILSLPPCITQQLSVRIITSSTCTDVMCLDIVDYHSLFLPKVS
jgi:hypothetical protein